jgi:AcrR family transcriptional regulator
VATQQERRTGTRVKLLRAATDVLVEAGAHGFTTTEVGKRAGLSQGAVFRHFASKAELLAATVESIFAGLVDRYQREFTSRASTVGSSVVDRVDASFDLLWEIFQDPELLAAYDLFAASRTDPDLQADLQPVVRAHVARLHELTDLSLADLAMVDHELLHTAVDLVAATMQGLVINRLAVADPEVEGRVRRLLHGSISGLLLGAEVRS